LAPPVEYDESVCAAAAMQAVAVVTVATFRAVVYTETGSWDSSWRILLLGILTQQQLYLDLSRLVSSLCRSISDRVCSQSCFGTF